MAVVNIAVSELIEKLNAKSPGMDPFDWFVVGFLYHCQHNAESVEEVYTRVKKITDLKTVAHLSNEEKNDFLIRMVDKIAVNKTKLQQNQLRLLFRYLAGVKEKHNRNPQPSLMSGTAILLKQKPLLRTKSCLMSLTTQI